MLVQIHDHITKELEQNTKTDTIFILTSILLNMITLAVMFVFVSLIVMVYIVVIIGLLKGRQTRMKRVTGLLKMYRDQDVAKYYDESLVGNYNIRYNLFLLVVVCTGVIATIVPFMLR